MAIYAAFFLAAALWFGLWAGMGILLARVAELGAVICFVIALGTGGWAWRMARRYLLYLVQGAHIAAMTEIMCGRQVPTGPGQVGYARGIMKEYFKDVSQLFLLDGLVKGAVKSITGTVVNLTRILPLPGLVAAALALGAITGSNMVVFFGFLMAVAGARLVELALYEPFAMAYTIVTFHRETDSVEPDPTWTARTEGMSSRFRELTQGPGIRTGPGRERRERCGRVAWPWGGARERLIDARPLGP